MEIRRSARFKMPIRSPWILLSQKVCYLLHNLLFIHMWNPPVKAHIHLVSVGLSSDKQPLHQSSEVPQDICNDWRSGYLISSSMEPAALKSLRMKASTFCTSIPLPTFLMPLTNCLDTYGFITSRIKSGSICFRDFMIRFLLWHFGSLHFWYNRSAMTSQHQL